jgi:hypothetical protein
MPNRGLKYGGPKRQRTALMGVFFFSGRTRPFIYTFGRSDQFRCQKSAPAGLRFAGIFPATGRPAETPCSSKVPRASPQANVFFFMRSCLCVWHNNVKAKAHTHTHKPTSVTTCIEPEGQAPPPTPHGRVCACLCVVPVWCLRPILNVVPVCLSACRVCACLCVCVGICCVPLLCRSCPCACLWACVLRVLRLCVCVFFGAFAFVHPCVCVSCRCARLCVCLGVWLRAYTFVCAYL